MKANMECHLKWVDYIKAVLAVSRNHICLTIKQILRMRDKLNLN